jgi:hypothetical protein
MISFRRCGHCKGIGKVLVPEGGGEYRIAKKMGAIGLGPGIRKGHSAQRRNNI